MPRQKKNKNKKNKDFMGRLCMDVCVRNILAALPEVAARLMFHLCNLEYKDEYQTVLFSETIVNDNLRDRNKTVDLLVEVDKHIYMNLEANKIKYRHPKIERNFGYQCGIYIKFAQKGDGEEAYARKTVYQVNINSSSDGDKAIQYYGVYLDKSQKNI